MFGGSESPPKDKVDPCTPSPAITAVAIPNPDTDKAPSPTKSPKKSPTREPSEKDKGPQNQTQNSAQGPEKKRRSSSVNKAAALFTSAKNSLHLGSLRDSFSRDTQVAQSPLQALGKMDPALAVPQGPLNNSAGESLPTENSTFRVGVTEDKNKKCRRTMEDTHSYLYNFLGSPVQKDSESNSSENADSEQPSQVVETDNGYFSIFDGHAGAFAAEWCGKKLHLILEEMIRNNPNAPIPELLDQSFTSADNQLEKLPLKNSGCTAVTAVLRWEDRPTKSADETQNSSSPQTHTRSRILYTANVGDARIILCRNGKALRLSYDHKGSDEHEGRRITSAGGLVLNNRVNGVLAVTRALGDSYMKDLVTGHPYTTETVVQPEEDEFIILACDGLWDVCTDQEAVDLIYKIEDPQEASKTLVDHALSRFSTDNLSVMVVRLDKKAMQEFAKKAPPPVNADARASSTLNRPSNRTSKRLSEAENLVELAKQSTANSGPANNGDANANATFIAEALDQEMGPEVSLPEGQEKGGVSLASALKSSKPEPNDPGKTDTKEQSK